MRFARAVHAGSGRGLARGARAASLSSLAALGVCCAPVAAHAGGGTVYVTNEASKDVGLYAIGSHGSLAALTPPTIAAGEGPSGVLVSPNGASVYVSNGGEPTVSQYDVSPTTGQLTPKSPAFVLSGGSFIHGGIAETPGGTSVYVTNFNENSVSQYDVDPITGALGSKTPAAVAAGKHPQDIALTPDGKSAYVVNEEEETVSQYDINPTTGALTVKASAIAAGVGAAGIAVSPDGRSAYVSGAGAIWQYDISPSTGVLSHKSPSSVSAGHASGTDDTSPIAVSPNGKSVYECDGGAAEPAVFEYDRNGTTGDLTPKTPASVAAPAEAVNLAIALDGKSVYVTIPFAEKGASEKVVVFAVNRKTGLLSPKSSASATGMTPLGLAVGALPHHRHKHH